MSWISSAIIALRSARISRGLASRIPVPDKAPLLHALRPLCATANRETSPGRRAPCSTDGTGGGVATRSPGSVARGRVAHLGRERRKFAIAEQLAVVRDALRAGLDLVPVVARHEVTGAN